MTESKQTERAVYGTRPATLPTKLPKGAKWKPRGMWPGGEFTADAILKGARYVGLGTESDHNELDRFVNVEWVDWTSVPLPPSETPDQERPECDACGNPSCDSSTGLTNYDCVRWYDETIGRAFGVEVLHLCAVHWNDSPERTVKAIRSRRAALAEKKEFKVGDYVVGVSVFNGSEYAGTIARIDRKEVTIMPSNCTLTLDSLRHETPPVKAHGDGALCSACGLNPVAVGCHCEHCHRRRVERAEVTAPKPDPYAEHQRHLDRDMALVNDAAVAVATDRQNELRHHGWAKKQRQALEQLKSPMPAKRWTILVGHPKSWPSDCDAEELYVS